MLTLPPEDTGYNPKGTMKVNLNNARKKPFCFDLSDFQERKSIINLIFPFKFIL